MNSQIERQFSRYLTNLMSKEERDSFENKLEKDEVLKNEFEEYQIGMKVGERIQYLDLKEKVGQIIEAEDLIKNNPKSTGTIIRRMTRPRYAAAVTLFIISLSTFGIYQNNLSGPDLFTQGISTESLDTRRNESEEISIDNVKHKIRSKDWDGALSIIAQLPQDIRKQPDNKRLAGYAHIGNGNMNLAKSTYHEAASSAPDQSEDQLIAYYYLGLLFTESEQFDSSRFYLQKVINSEFNFPAKKSAEQMLSKLWWKSLFTFD